MTKIMLVEDDNNLREIYEARLSAEGYEIVAAENGEAALALAAKERPDMIISDVMMPKISGFEMLDILRNTDSLKNVKIIMLTALGQAEDSQRANSLGADRYLVKSQVTLEDIVKAAHDLLDDPNMARMPDSSETEGATEPDLVIPSTSTEASAPAIADAPTAPTDTAGPVEAAMVPPVTEAPEPTVIAPEVTVEPEAVAVTEPVAEPAAEPIVEPAATPVVEIAEEQTPEPAVEPTPEPVEPPAGPSVISIPISVASDGDDTDTTDDATATPDDVITPTTDSVVVDDSSAQTDTVAPVSDDIVQSDTTDAPVEPTAPEPIEIPNLIANPEIQSDDDLNVAQAAANGPADAVPVPDELDTYKAPSITSSEATTSTENDDQLREAAEDLVNSATEAEAAENSDGPIKSKIIAPLTGDDRRPDINQLLAVEEARNGAQQAASAQTDQPKPNVSAYAPSTTITPQQTQQSAQSDSIDPNSISL